ncbi:MAG: ABC transporter ATP-binding protein [Burkholderiaceae bacterium]
MAKAQSTSGHARPTDAAGDRAEPAPLAAALTVDDLWVSFGSETTPFGVLNGLSFDLQPGSIGCLLGASGCGKTTAMRTIAGFVHPNRGRVLIDRVDQCDPAHWIEPEHRPVGVVFQDYALFPHLSVAQNVGFGLRRLSRTERREQVSEMLTLTGLTSQAAKYPHELSGGQQQRVALARALAPKPRVLLLDEPFSNLDPDLRERLAHEVRDVLKATATTTLVVTHDQYEAFAMADVVGVMEAGRIAQWDTSYNLYHRPESRWVADFVGQGSFLTGTVNSHDGQSSVAIELGELPIEHRKDQSMATAQADTKNRVEVLLRPDDVIHDDASPIKARVIRKAFRGASFMYTLRLPSGDSLMALVPSHHDHALGEFIGIRFAADHVVTFPYEGSPNPASD